MTFKKLDIRRMAGKGIEPFPRIRAQVDALRPGEGLAIVAPFLPSPLIELLRGENVSSRAERNADGSWVTYFWREEDGV